MDDVETGSLGMTAQSRPLKVAVLIRTHVVSEKLIDLLHMLSASRRYDLFVAADETRGPLDIGAFRKLPHDAGMCSAFGLVDYHSNIMWHCGDYALYFSAAQIPDYDYYIMIEYDVDFVRRSPVFLEHFIARLVSDGQSSPDFIAPRYDGANSAWCWTAAADLIYPKVFYTGIFAFICVSRAALKFLQSERVKEAKRQTPPANVIHCEAFCGTAISAGNFKAMAIGAMMPGVISFESFHNPGLDQPTPFYASDYYRIEDPAIELVHPVFDFETYLDKQFSVSKQRRALETFVDELSALSPTCERDAGLIATYIARAQEQIATT